MINFYIFLIIFNILYSINCKNILYHEIVLHIKESDNGINSYDLATSVAKRHGLKLVKKIFPNLNYFLFYKILNTNDVNNTINDLEFRYEKRMRRSMKSYENIQESLNNETMV
jgi:hypothetical protein